MEDLDKNTLRYLAGVKQKIDECMGAMPLQAPQTPASISVTAGSGEELSGMLKSLMTLAGVSPVTPSHMPVNDPSKGPSKVISAPPMSQGPDMKTLLAAMDEQDVEEDSMNPDDQHDWDNSPNQEGKAVGDWPMDGDQDNNLSANKDRMVDRHNNVTAEGLFAAYEDFVAESTKPKCCCKEKGKKKCPVHGKVEEAFRPLLPKQKSAQKSADRQSVAQSGKVGAGAGPEMKSSGRVPMQSKEKTKYVRDRAAKFSEELEQTDETLNVEEAKKWVKKAVKGIKKGALRKQEGKKKGEKFSKSELKGLAKSGTPKERKRAQFALNISKKK